MFKKDFREVSQACGGAHKIMTYPKAEKYILIFRTLCVLYTLISRIIQVNVFL